MSIESILGTVRAYARDRKSRFIAGDGHLLLAVRDGSPMAVLSCGELNVLLRFAGAVAAGYGADSLAVVIEGVVPMVGANPLTGNRWQAGEAEQLWREHEGAERGWVSETQILVVASRTGETAEAGWPFHRVDGSIVWGETQLKLSRTGLAEILMTRVATPVLDASQMPEPADDLGADSEHDPILDLEHGRLALDIGCTRIFGRQLAEGGKVWMIVGSGDEAERLVREGLPPWQVEVFAGCARGYSRYMRRQS